MFGDVFASIRVGLDHPCGPGNVER